MSEDLISRLTKKERRERNRATWAASPLNANNMRKEQSCAGL